MDLKAVYVESLELPTKTVVGLAKVVYHVPSNAAFWYLFFRSLVLTCKILKLLSNALGTAFIVSNTFT